MHQQNVKHIIKQFTNVLKINKLINFLPVLTCLSEFFLRNNKNSHKIYYYYYLFFWQKVSRNFFSRELQNNAKKRLEVNQK